MCSLNSDGLPQKECDISGRRAVKMQSFIDQCDNMINGLTVDPQLSGDLLHQAIYSLNVFRAGE